MYNSYLTGLVGDQRRQQLIAEAAEHRRARASRPAASSQTKRTTRPLRGRLARLIFAN
jgi:hypothetical protein